MGFPSLQTTNEASILKEFHKLYNFMLLQYNLLDNLKGLL